MNHCSRRAWLESRGFLYAVMTLLAFLISVIISLGGLFLFNMNGDFYSALQGEINQGFFLSALLVLIFSSILFTPFSYGISHYFILSARERASFRALFFLFHQPILLTKATVVSILKKILIYFERLLLLLVAAILEVLLFFSFLLVSGADIFSVQENPFRLAAAFMLGSPWLVGLSILLWSCVLYGFILINLRYLLCKYVLLQYPAANVMQAVQVGRQAIRGKLFRTLLFYLRFCAIAVLTTLSFGLSARFADGIYQRSFSSYACELVEKGWQDYCRRRSLRN